MFYCCPTKKFNIHPAHSLLRFWVGETYFSWTFITGSASVSRAHRVSSRMQAFIKSFFNGRYKWTVYFNEAILERIYVFTFVEGELNH